MDTIYAVATGRVKAGLSVIRISGPRAFEAAEKIAGILPVPRCVGLRKLRDRHGEIIDEAIVLCFEEGQSFTGEKVAELHVHGSLAVVSAILRELALCSGLRMALPGEFSRRALENDRLDLAQIEGLSDLIEAETEAQRKQAVRVFSGILGKKVEEWRSDLIRAAALIEVTIDFADEDVPLDVTPEVRDLVSGVIAAVQTELAGARIAERIRDGFEVAIIGAPNAGKSTLLNALAGREAAITSEYAGTTRDVIEVRMDLGGLPVTLLDTAGLRESADPVESIGIARAKERAESADLRVFVLSFVGEEPSVRLEADDIVVLGKADLRSDVEVGRAISGISGDGLDELVAEISTILSRRAEGASDVIRRRHREALSLALQSLESARDGLERHGLELVAADLRSSASSLEIMIGRIGVEDYLGEIFSRFCIGK